MHDVRLVSMNRSFRDRLEVLVVIIAIDILLAHLALGQGPHARPGNGRRRRHRVVAVGPRHGGVEGRRVSTTAPAVGRHLAGAEMVGEHGRRDAGTVDGSVGACGRSGAKGTSRGVIVHARGGKVQGVESQMGRALRGAYWMDNND